MPNRAEKKSEAINLRMSPSTKELLRRVADKEHRTLSNMLEVLIIERAERLDVAEDVGARNGVAGKQTKRRSA